MASGGQPNPNNYMGNDLVLVKVKKTKKTKPSVDADHQLHVAAVGSHEQYVDGNEAYHHATGFGGEQSYHTVGGHPMYRYLDSSPFEVSRAPVPDIPKVSSRQNSFQYNGERPDEEFKQRYSQVIEELDSRNSGVGHQEDQIPGGGAAAVTGGYALETGSPYGRRDASTQYKQSDLRAQTYYFLGGLSFFCCPVFSLISIMASLRVSSLRRSKDNDAARIYSSVSVGFGGAAVFIGMVVYIVLIFVMLRSNISILWEVL